MAKLNIAAVCTFAVLASTAHASGRCYTQESSPDQLPMGTVFKVNKSKIEFNSPYTAGLELRESQVVKTEIDFVGDEFTHPFECVLSSSTGMPQPLQPGTQLELVGPARSQRLELGGLWGRPTITRKGKVCDEMISSWAQPHVGLRMTFPLTGGLTLRCDYLMQKLATRQFKLKYTYVSGRKLGRGEVWTSAQLPLDAPDPFTPRDEIEAREEDHDDIVTHGCAIEDAGLVAAPTIGMVQTILFDRIHIQTQSSQQCEE